MELMETDVVILGAGTAGLNARREVERAGRRWVMVEPGPYGTTCARVGCMPSKLLIAAGDAAHEVAHADLFGVHVAPEAMRIDGREVLERVRRERDRFVGFVLADQAKLPPELNPRGHARFVGPTTVEVRGERAVRVEARAVVVATGSAPTLPPALEAAQHKLGERLLTNDSVFELRELPASLAVVGSGVIGLELGQAMHRLRVRTTILGRHGVAGLRDPAVRDKAVAVLQRELRWFQETELLSADRDKDGVRLVWRAEGDTITERFAYVLAATGRRPAVDGLGLDAVGVPFDARGRPRCDPRTMQCGELPIFLAGDVTGHRAVLHEAADEGRIAGRNAATWPEVAAAERRCPLEITFTDPQIARVGVGFDDLSDEDHAIGEVSYDNQGRSRIAGKNAGLVRLYGARADRRLVGAELVGPRVEHLAHLLAWVVQAGLTVDETLGLPFYHPVFEEGIRTGLQDLRRRLDG